MPHRTAHTLRRSTLTAAALLGAALLAGCSGPNNTESTQPSAADGAQATLAEHDLDGLTGQEVVDTLETTEVSERPTDLMASVQPNSVVLTDATGAETELELQDDQTYVSVAPYVSQTHECFYHSLTTCLGELQNTEVEVTITNDADGSVLAEGPVTTEDNGFVGFWLPSDIDATMTIVDGERSNTSQISTGAEDPTCITTAQLT